MTVLAALGLAWCLRGLWLLGRGLLSGLNGFRVGTLFAGILMLKSIQRIFNYL